MTRLLTTIAPASRCERETSSRPGSSLAGCQGAAISARGEPPGIYEEIKPTFDQLMREATADESRPSLEHYRRHDEIDLLVPIL